MLATQGRTPKLAVCATVQPLCSCIKISVKKKKKKKKKKTCICPSGYAGNNCILEADGGNLPNIVNGQRGSDTGVITGVVIILLLLMLLLIAVVAIAFYIKKRSRCTGTCSVDIWVKP